jgi:hypothetical protein
MKPLLESLIAAIPLSTEIQHLVEARSYLHHPPPRHSFAYIRLLRSLYADFQVIANTANPIKQCPRSVIHPDINFSCFRPSHIDFFRRSYCRYFANPLETIARFWTIFWEYKRVKKDNPNEFHETVAQWAWKRYTYREILGVARFNGSYYSRIITSGLNCQRDALLTVLEIYRSKLEKHESWSINDGNCCICG